jgi:E3 ubiquitin-protein ligase HUWE1
MKYFTRTKIAIKMSRSSAKSSKDAAGGAKAESAPSSDSEDDEDLEDTGREETPDLYRNSALGMYGGVGPALKLTGTRLNHRS